MTVLRSTRFPRPRRSVVLAALTAAALIALAAAACGGADDPAGPAPSEPSPQAADPTLDQSVAEEEPALDREPPAPPATVQIGPTKETAERLEGEPRIYVVPQEVRQGAAFLIAVDAPGAGFASTAYNGQIFTLLREGDRFFTILPVDALSPLGPTPVVISVSDAAGRQVLRRETLITVTDAAWQIEVVELDASNQALLDPAVIAEDTAIRESVERRLTPERHWSGLFDLPAAGVITSSFGLLRSYNFAEPSEYHQGLDFAGDSGDPVLAPNAGVVAWVGQTRRRGNGIVIDHGGGIFSAYYHLSEVLVTPGSVVISGAPLGRVGATGLATGPHLHWEIVVHGIPVDPVQWIRDQDVPDPAQEFDPATAIGPAGTVDVAVGG